jgi:hypothetical protein
MPIPTTVYIHDPVDYETVFARCCELVGAPAGMKPSRDRDWISTGPDEGGMRAWTWVEHGWDGPPLRAAQAPHTEHCGPDCSYQHAPACWLEAVFDTADDNYSDEHGGAGTLHQRLVTGLGQWLDAQAVAWSWRTHGNGIVHNRHEGLSTLPLLDK